MRQVKKNKKAEIKSTASPTGQTFLTAGINSRGGSRNDFSLGSPSPSSDSQGRLKISYNFPSRSPILMIFTFLKMALKFIGSSSLLEECGSNISSISKWTRPITLR